jgi:hypothetical protein
MKQEKSVATALATEAMTVQLGGPIAKRSDGSQSKPSPPLSAQSLD